MLIIVIVILHTVDIKVSKGRHTHGLGLFQSGAVGVDSLQIKSYSVSYVKIESALNN